MPRYAINRTMGDNVRDQKLSTGPMDIKTNPINITTIPILKI